MLEKEQAMFECRTPIQRSAHAETLCASFVPLTDQRPYNIEWDQNISLRYHHMSSKVHASSLSYKSLGLLLITLPCFDWESQIPRLIVKGAVSVVGRFEDPKLDRSTRNEALDHLILEAASRALFRPARREGRYVEAPAIIVFHWSI